MKQQGRRRQIICLTWLLGLLIIVALVLLSLYYPVRDDLSLSGPFTAHRRTIEFIQRLEAAVLTYRMANDNRWPPEEPAQLARSIESKESRQYRMIEFQAGELDARGEPIDAWGTVMRFKFSNARIIISSAGEDRVFGTADDLGVEP